MALPLQKLQIGTNLNDAYAIVNDNFDKVVQDIRDLGANLSTTGTTNATLGAGTLTPIVFTLTSLGITSDSIHQCFTTAPVSSVSGIAPQVDIYVDTEDADHLWPSGSALSVGQQNLYPIVTPSLTGYTNSLAAWVISLNNRDSSSHTYYLRTRCGYFPTGPTGFYR